MRKKRNKHRKNVLLVSSKLNNMEIKISNALANAKTSDKELFTLVSSDVKSYRKLKESIRMKNSQMGDKEKDKLI